MSPKIEYIHLLHVFYKKFHRLLLPLCFSMKPIETFLSFEFVFSLSRLLSLSKLNKFEFSKLHAILIPFYQIFLRMHVRGTAPYEGIMNPSLFASRRTLYARMRVFQNIFIHNRSSSVDAALSGTGKTT